MEKAKKILEIIVLVSVLLASWGVGYRLVTEQIVLDKCVNQFHATGGFTVWGKGYCTATFYGDSYIASVLDMENRQAEAQQNKQEQ